MERFRHGRQRKPVIREGTERENDLMRPVAFAAEEIAGRVDRTGRELPGRRDVARYGLLDRDGLRQHVFLTSDRLLCLRCVRETEFRDLDARLEERQNLQIDIHQRRAFLVATGIPAWTPFAVQMK